MKNLKNAIIEALANENGGPQVEQLINVAVALGVGVGLFLVGRAMYNWLAGDSGATSVITNLEKGTPEKFW